MAGASDKARFFLEQSIPELKEYERKKLFSSDEITSIARKRSDFEHKLNTRECRPSDYSRYAEFEINLDTLRRKRVKRLKVKAPVHTGQRRVFFILDRATRKFPGDIGLWMQQIEYARLQKAYKKLSQILTKALRLHPSRPDLWTYAGHVAMEEHADVTEARSYMQRGLRFCKGSKSLWLEYMKLEVLYITKITARRQILGLDESSETKEGGKSFNESSAEVTSLPPPTAENDHRPSPTSTNHADRVSSQNFVSTPALSGAIPIAIFDAAMVQFDDDEKVAQDFFDIVLDMDTIPCMRSILQHIVSNMLRSRPTDWRTLVCNVKISCVGIAISSPGFPQGLRCSLKTLQGAPLELRRCREVVDAMQSWLGSLMKNDSLDVALHQIMRSTLRQLHTTTASSLAGIGPEE